MRRTRILFACVVIAWAVALARVWPGANPVARVVMDDEAVEVASSPVCSSKHWHLLLPWNIYFEHADASIAVNEDGAWWRRGDAGIGLTIDERSELLAALAAPCGDDGERSERDLTAIAYDRGWARYFGWEPLETRARLAALFDRIARRYERRYESHRAPLSILDCALRSPRAPHAPRVVALRAECAD